MDCHAHICSLTMTSYRFIRHCEKDRRSTKQSTKVTKDGLPRSHMFARNDKL
ncbi:hypothetical protein RiCNE_01840 [Rickettsia endosymbiont of Culicoides newsteadi]|nr:hypothetical protein RiCNE_01840 [Rickettsia endosymbiont of Culicoides newsteadi]